MMPSEQPKRVLYFINEIVEDLLRRYIWTGCTSVKLRDDIMVHATELIRQIIRKQGLHTIYPGQDESSFNDLLQTAWIQIERTLYKFRAKPHCRPCYNPDRPNDSALYHPGDLEYGIIDYERLRAIGIKRCPNCGVLISDRPEVTASQDVYGGSESVLFRGNSKVFNMWCVAPSTMVPTCHGPLPASEILSHFEAGLPIHIQGLDGLAPVEAMKVRDVTDTLIMTTKLGFDLECSPEHRIYAIRANGDDTEWPQASELRVGDLVAVQYAQDAFSERGGSLDNIILTRRGDWQAPPAVTDELAYIIGLFIAEGSYSYGKLVIYNVDEEVINRLTNNNLGLNFINEPDYQRVSLCNVRFIEFLQQLGFHEHTSAQTKVIPDRLLCWPRHAIRAMLSGMFDGDGHSSRHNGCVGYTTTSRALLSQLRMILLNMGMLSKVTRDKRESRTFKRRGKARLNAATYTSKLSGAWQLLLSATASRLFYDTIGFGITRKQSKAVNLAPARELIHGLNDKFRALYAKYGTSAGRYNDMRRMLKAATCTVDVARYALTAWAAYSDDSDYAFIAARVSEYDAEKDRLIWLPIRSIKHGRSELIDMAVDAPSHSYVANGIVVHNSQVSRTVILAHIKKEGRDRKNAPSYRDYIGRKVRHGDTDTNEVVSYHHGGQDKKPIKLSGMMLRFFAEAREMCKYNDDHMTILAALENILRVDERPAEGIIGKLVEHSGLSRVAVTQFMKMIRLRSFEFTDSPIARAEEVHHRDRRSHGSPDDGDD